MRNGGIASLCCAFVLALALVGCGGGASASSEETSPKDSAPVVADTQAADAEAQAAEAEAQAAAALEEGLGYWFGTGAEGYDKEKARAAFQRAADGGNAEGWYWLGALAACDVGADRWPQVIDYYQKAADAGCAKGWCGLGVLYETGFGVEADVARATELYQQAIDAGELLGCVRMGDLYRDGNGVEASGARAAELYEQASAAQDFSTRNAARCALGRMYCYGAEGIELDAARALELYQQAADEDYYAGWRGLGHLYDNGETMDGSGVTVERDDARGFECYAREAELGSVYNLGVCYEYGDGCEADYARAIELFTQETEGGRSAAYAMCGLAYMASEGMGMDQDYAVSADWCRRAMDAAGPGDDSAVDFANELLEWLENNS